MQGHALIEVFLEAVDVLLDPAVDTGEDHVVRVNITEVRYGHLILETGAPVEV